MIYIPSQFSLKLNISEPTNLDIEFLNYDFKKGNYIKLKPHLNEFYGIMDVKSYLENNLVKLYSHLQKNQIIQIPYGEKIYYFDIIDTKPDNIISIIDTDLEVDLDIAYDYKPPPPKKNNSKFSFKFNNSETKNKETNTKQEFKPFSGKGRKLNE